MTLESGRVPTTVGVIIVSYNSAEWLERCLSSLPDSCQRHDRTVVVFDNASDDGSADLVAEHPGVHLVRSSTNLGFAKAVNRAAQELSTDYILLLNPDGHLEKHAIDELIDFAEANPQFVICGGRTLTPDGALDPRSCWGAPTLWSLTSNALLLSVLFRKSRLFCPEAMVGFQRDEIRQVDIVTGCLLLIRTSDWVDLGGFDERYFVYGEDADLCLRARERGRQCAITPQAVMVHACGGSAESVPLHHELVLAGRVTLLLIRWNPIKARLGQAMVICGVLLRALLGPLTNSADGILWREVWRRRRNWWGGYLP